MNRRSPHFGPQPEPAPTKAVIYNIGEAVKVLRQVKGISQGELARKFKTSRQWVTKVEGGQITPEIQSVRKLAKVLEIPSRVLVAMAEGKKAA